MGRVATTASSIPAPAEGLCFAFANTRHWRGSDPPTETLAGFSDVLKWLGASAGLNAVALRNVANHARKHPDDAVRFFGEAIGVREAIYRIFSAVAEARPASNDDLDALNRMLGNAPPRKRIAAA